jgi:hypothetical protein
MKDKISIDPVDFIELLQYIFLPDNLKELFQDEANDLIDKILEQNETTINEMNTFYQGHIMKAFNKHAWSPRIITGGKR